MFVGSMDNESECDSDNDEVICANIQQRALSAQLSCFDFESY